VISQVCLLPPNSSYDRLSVSVVRTQIFASVTGPDYGTIRAVVGNGGMGSAAVGLLTYVAATGRGRRGRTSPCQARACNRLVPLVVFMASRLPRPPARYKEVRRSDADMSVMPSLIRRPRRSKVGLRGHSQDVGPCASGVITGSLGGATPRVA
jgi:hypothetical protein